MSVTIDKQVRLALENALSERFGQPITIASAPRNFWPSCVFRCRLVRSDPDSAPETVIVRVPRAGTTRPDSGGLDHERRALQYLITISSDLAPQFYAGGAEAGFVAMEDLGDGPSLLDLLLGKDPDAARQGALAFARGLGQLHALTAKPADPILADLPAIDIPVTDTWPQVRDAVAQVGLPEPRGVDQDIAAVEQLLAEPGGCLALSSGDPSVVNCKIVGGHRVRFFDFEGAGFRHALADTVVLRYLYPTGGPPWRLPPAIAQEVEDAYRAELAPACAMARDDDRFERGMSAASLAWTILRLARLQKVEAGPDRDPWPLLPSGWAAPIPTRSRRRQLVAILETAIESAHRAHAFVALADWCNRLADALRARWPEAVEELPIYPAFL